jgi:AcrR family transcriptional regulator
MSMYSDRQTPTAEPEEAWEPQPLPRGRHKLGRDEVQASQRDRILRAMLECVAADGYSATTVQRVAAAARVSPNSFYKFFEGKLDCFLAVLDADAEQLLERLLREGAAPDWRDALRNGMRVYLEWWPARPQVSRAFLVELPAAGGEAVTRRSAIQERFVAVFLGLAARARQEQPDLPPVSTAAIRVLVHGMTELMSDEVRAGRVEGLTDLEPELVGLTARVIADDATAVRLAA